MTYAKVFLDADGIRWAATPQLASADTVPIGFSFTSQHGERRVLDGILADCISWEDLDDHEWRDLLQMSRAVRLQRPTRRRFR